MTLAPGSRLGPYQLETAIGAGGMGEVYRARDTRLDRVVAVKTLPVEFSDDAQRRARFRREAKAIASLTHPHICALHDVGEHEGTDYLVMELLEGETLAQRLSRGPLTTAQAVFYAIQIADALATAHRAGVVHRDLKPGNVMITRGGAKLLDFGLATPTGDRGPIDAAQTMTGPVTEEGQTLGTLGYMSPEQLEGRHVDARTDIFALGAMLFEMTTGRRAFDGSGSASVIGHVLHTDPPPITDLVPGAPPALARLVRVCLAKDPDERWSSAHDLYLQLKGLTGPDETDRPVPERKASREWIAWTLAGIATVITIGLALTRGTRAPVTPPPLDLLSIVPPADTIQPFADAPQISPDGRHVAFVATDRSGRTSVYVRSFDTDTARALPDTDDASLPFWAPDSRRLGFFASGQLKTTTLDAEASQVLTTAPVPRGGTWSANDVIVFSPIPSLPLQQIAAAGGTVRPVASEASTVPARNQRWFPSFLPDGRRYLFLGRASPADPYMVSIASLDSTDTKPLVESRAPAVFAGGYLLYRREGTLVAQEFDLESAELRGTAVPIVDRVGFNVITYQGLFSASTTGRLAFQSSAVQAELTWYDRRGNRIQAAAGVGGYNTVCLMPDSRRLVYELADEATGNVDLWTFDPDKGPPTRLTFEPTVDFYPVCPAVGNDVVFASLRDGPPNLLKVPIDAPGNVSVVLSSQQAKIPTDVSHDGRLLVYSSLQAGTSWDIFVMPQPEGPARPLAATAAEEGHAKLSPDGRWVAYVSNESGRQEVYVQPLPATGAKWQVSTGGAAQPQWRRDGRELYYLSTDKKLMAADLKPRGATFVWGTPRALMETRVTGWERINAGCCQYAVSPDGERFLISNSTSTASPITIAVNWRALLSR